MKSNLNEIIKKNRQIELIEENFENNTVITCPICMEDFILGEDFHLKNKYFGIAHELCLLDFDWLIIYLLRFFFFFNLIF